MDPVKRQLRSVASLLATPEMRVFWVFLPFLLVLLVIDILYLSKSLALVSGGLLVIVGVAVFFSAFRIERTNEGTKIERSELKSIVLGLEDALVVYDQSFKVLFFNPAAEELFGLKGQAVVGRIMKPQDAEKPEWRLLAQAIFPSLAPTLVTRSRAGEYPQVVDLSFDEPRLELRVITSQILRDDRTLFGFMKTIRDRTREMGVIRSKNEFITVASHQLRTPINEIRWALETLEQEEGLSEEGKQLLQGTGQSARKLSNIVEDLLNISKIEEGRFGYNFEQIDLVEFLGKILTNVLPQAQRAGLKLYFDRPKESLPPTMIDTVKLSMVVSNLLDNAMRYNVQNGEITVKVGKQEQSPFLEVGIKDTGVGIPPEEVTKIFTKFFRASNVVRFQTDGSGLGLYIARNIVQAHGGQMWAESELNRGTTFHFTLPTDPTLVPRRETTLEL